MLIRQTRSSVGAEGLQQTSQPEMRYCSKQLQHEARSPVSSRTATHKSPLASTPVSPPSPPAKRSGIGQSRRCLCWYLTTSKATQFLPLSEMYTPHRTLNTHASLPLPAQYPLCEPACTVLLPNRRGSALPSSCLLHLPPHHHPCTSQVCDVLHPWLPLCYEWVCCSARLEAADGAHDQQGALALQCW